MRRILVDHARAKQAAKRAGALQRIELTDDAASLLPPETDVLALNEALQTLEKLHPLAAQVVELRYFAGLTEKEAAETLGISVTTLKREWEFARAWLFKQLQP
jgi:RNA polymerase sigma-70 factor, ECF subfamily